MKRRHLLGTLSGSALVGIGGCLGETPTTSGVSEQSDVTTESSPDDGVETPGEPVVRFSVESRIFREQFLTVQITRGGERVLTQTVKTPRVGKRGMSGDLTPGETYRIVAELDTGERFESEWELAPDARLLTFVLTTDGGLTVIETTTRDPLDGELPYTIAGAEDIFVPPGLDVRNESDEDVALTVVLEHDGDRFFERTLDLASRREITTDALVKSHATYDVFVETADGRRTVDEWHVPEAWAWPKLAVLVARDGTLKVGGGWPRVARLPVENNDDTEHEVTTTVIEGDEVVTATRRTVSPGAGQLTVELPIGDEYEVTVETNTGSDTATFVACDCWHTEATLYIEDGVPSIEAIQYFCS